MTADPWNIDLPPATPAQIEKLGPLLYLLDKLEASELIVLLKKRADEKIYTISVLKEPEPQKGK